MYVLNQACFRSGQCNLPEKMLRLVSYTYLNCSLVNVTHHSSNQYLPSIHSLRVFQVRCYLSQCFLSVAPFQFVGCSTTTSNVSMGIYLTSFFFHPNFLFFILFFLQAIINTLLLIIVNSLELTTKFAP